MRTTPQILSLTFLLAGMIGCNGTDPSTETQAQSGHSEVAEAEPAKGPHGGRLLADGEFLLELSIFETGVPPEFRVWVTQAGKASARYQGNSHQWRYDNLEGRTRIGADVAAAFGLETELVGPATIRETIRTFGRIEPNPEQRRAVSARFDGVIQSVRVSVGDTVKRGQILATVESNESLKPYNLAAPIGGVVTQREANTGEQTRGRQLFTILDTTSVWAELAVFPSAHDRVRAGAPVIVNTTSGSVSRVGKITRLNTLAEPNQSVLARVVLDNADGALVPGTYITGEIQVAEYEVPLAVKRTGLQAFRDFTVVYTQIDDQYEVRMLDLGRQDSQWVEVMGGIDPGARYVTTNSYLIKADIEKSGASHDH